MHVLPLSRFGQRASSPITSGTTSTFIRFPASSSPARMTAASLLLQRRPLSTTPVWRNQNPASSDAWPPKRENPASLSSSSPAATQSSSSSPLKNIYSSDNPAQWAMWSTDEFYKRHTAGKPRGPKLRLKPSTGRTVHVSGHVDPARAFQMVNSLCRRNKVANDFHRQRFHERPGLRRKRLASERWRKRFRESFKHVAARVLELAKQGW